jgi:NAD(P)-dependent dehydrogenase (short-subunit alcohol dehydrogenase family)
MSLLRKTALLAAGAGLTAWAVKTAREHKRWFSFAGRTVIVTGGSRGLGLVLARQLVDRGARIVIAARTEEDLEAAQQELEQRGGEVLAIPCDVTSAKQVHEMVESAIERFGTIDVLFNVAGIIEVGPLDAMTDEDFRHAMDTNCWGVLNTVRAVLPTMRNSGWGRIVNIASLGGKRSVPHMLPYCTSKFAVVGLSEGLRAELAHENIFVTTICPSLMRTGSPRNAIFKGKHREEYAWFSIGDSLPMFSMSAELAAEQILEACQYGLAERLLRNPWNVSIALQSLFPGITREVLTFANRLLPEMGGIGKRAARGYESESAWSPSVLTALTEEAARKNNEMRPHPIQQDAS